MATITIAECRRCGSNYHYDAEPITIAGHEQVGIIKVKLASCRFCPPDERTSINPQRIIPDYKGWDDDPWNKKSNR